MNPFLSERLAFYGVIASATTATTVATGDIQVYEGSPISITNNYTTLSLPGLQFAMMNSIEIDRRGGGWASGGFTCCDWTTTSAGSICVSYADRMIYYAQSFLSLRVGCEPGAYLSGIQFQPVGAPVESPGCYDATDCFFSIYRSYNCDGWNTRYSGNCDGWGGIYHLGFKARGGAFPDNDWYRGWIRIEGPIDDLKITRWAYEDSGGPIDVGEEPPPACPADLNGDGQVNGQDLGILLRNFGKKGGGIGDVNGDGLINGGDLGPMLGSWGDCN